MCDQKIDNYFKLDPEPHLIGDKLAGHWLLVRGIYG